MCLCNTDGCNGAGVPADETLDDNVRMLPKVDHQSRTRAVHVNNIESTTHVHTDERGLIEAIKMKSLTLKAEVSNILRFEFEGVR